MDKLIELLNEYKIYTDHKKSRMSEYTWVNVGDDIVMASYVGTTKDKTLEILSKKYGFIKWLVDNDKIKLDFGFIYHTYDEDELGEKYSDLDSLIMILSIKDNPLDYLCGILR